jgi:glutaredoxin-like protein
LATVVDEHRTNVDDEQTPRMILYWRPGCGYCVRLARALDAMDVEPELHNIWEEPDAAAFVRSVNRGNELVPTLVVGDQVLSNPSADQVRAALARVQAA